MREASGQEGREKGDRHCRYGPRPKPTGPLLQSQSPFFRATAETGDESQDLPLDRDELEHLRRAPETALYVVRQFEFEYS